MEHKFDACQLVDGKTIQTKIALQIIGWLDTSAYLTLSKATQNEDGDEFMIITLNLDKNFWPFCKDFVEIEEEYTLLNQNAEKRHCVQKFSEKPSNVYGEWEIKHSLMAISQV